MKDQEFRWFKKVRLEFYPDLEHLIAKNHFTDECKHVVVTPSTESLRLFVPARFGKRRIMHHKTTSAQVNNVNVSLIRKYTGLKFFRRGRKFGALTLPLVTLDRKLIHQGRIVNRKEILKLFDEIFKYLLG